MPYSPFLNGKKVYLSQLNLLDATPTYVTWMHDEDTTRYLESGIFPETIESLQAYISNSNAQSTGLLLGIFEQGSDLHIGNLGLHNISWTNRTCELGIMIGNKDQRGKGYGKEACELVIDYCFHRLNLRKITLAVFSNNTKAMSLYDKLGFVVEGRMRNHIFKQGAYHDKIWMSLFRPEGI